jgi:hypothetical protein
MAQEAAVPAEPIEEGERDSEHDEVVGVEIRRRQHHAGAERGSLNLECHPAAPDQRDG